MKKVVEVLATHIATVIQIFTTLLADTEVRLASYFFIPALMCLHRPPSHKVLIYIFVFSLGMIGIMIPSIFGIIDQFSSQKDA